VTNPLTIFNNGTNQAKSQNSLGELPSYTPLSTELDEVFNCIPYQKLIRAMLDEKTKLISPLGRPGYSLEMMIKAYLASYILGVRSTNDLIRRLQENPVLALVCGFDLAKPLPHRTTFNRFFNKLIKYQDLVNECLNEVISKLHDLIPDFGEIVAIDATPIHSHSHPNKNPVSDPEAGFVYKGGAQGKYKWGFGYYLHAVADANLELPIAKKLSFWHEREKPLAFPLLKQARDGLPWLKMEAVLADAGYDGYHVYEDIVQEFDAEPIIDLATKRVPLVSGSAEMPICPAGLPLVHRRMVRGQHEWGCPAKFTKTKCPLPEQCPLKVAIINPGHDYRRFGYHIPRTCPEWQELYNKRTAVERVFSRLKDKRRLDSHCFRGFRKLNLHCSLSILVMQAMALAKMQSGHLNEIRTCARKVS
jgi:hypothetical protein